MVEWKEYRIKDICEIIDGDRGKNYPQDSDFYDEEFCLFLNAGNVTKNGWDFNNVHFITKEKDTLLRKGKASMNDIIMTTRGTVGNFTLFDNQVPYSNIRINSGMVIIRTIETIDKYFLLYLFKSDYVQNIIKLFCSGSAQPQLPIKDFNKIKLHFPPLPTQQKIASILSAYDNLIQNYKKQIEALQTAASELYKEWFVRFRFPGYQTTKFENGIPEGWAYIRLKDIVKFDRGISYSSEEIDCDDGVNLINLKNIEAYGGFRRDGTKKYNGKYKTEQIVKYGDLVMGITDMTQDRRTVGSVALIPNIEDISVISADLLRVTTKISKIFFYSLCRFGPYSRYFSMFANGANVLHLRPDSLLRKKILLPNNELIEKFDIIVSSIINKIDKLNLAIDNLTQQRDLLLPRLMSGKLEVE